MEPVEGPAWPSVQDRSVCPLSVAVEGFFL